LVNGREEWPDRKKNPERRKTAQRVHGMSQTNEGGTRKRERLIDCGGGKGEAGQGRKKGQYQFYRSKKAAKGVLKSAFWCPNVERNGILGRQKGNRKDKTEDIIPHGRT